MVDGSEFRYNMYLRLRDQSVYCLMGDWININVSYSCLMND